MDDTAGAEIEVSHADSIDKLSIDLLFQHGWLTITLSLEGSAIEISASTLAPVLQDLILGIQDIVHGRRSVAIRWEAEPGGFFIDISQGEKGWESGLCTIAIHPIDLDALDTLGDTSSARGPAVFAFTARRAGLVSQFVDAIASVKEPIDTITRRGHRAFPDATFAIFGIRFASRCLEHFAGVPQHPARNPHPRGPRRSRHTHGQTHPGRD